MWKPVLPQYALAIACAAAAVLLTALLHPLVEPGHLLLVLLAVVLSALYGGFRPGLVATLVGTLGSIYFLMPPVYSFGLERSSDLVRLALFGMAAILVCWLLDRLHCARRAADERGRELRASELRYRRIVDTANEGIWTLDAAGRTDYANRCLAEMLGCTPEEMIGRLARDFLADDPAAWEQWLHQPAGALSEPRDFRLRRSDGGELWAICSAARIKSEAGASVGTLIMVVDVTSRKQAEGALHTHAWQQAIVADLGLRALADTNLTTLVDEAIRAVAGIVTADLCEVLELLPDSQSLLLRAGVGWDPSLVGLATLPDTPDSYPGYVLQHREGFRSANLRDEHRFRPSALLELHGALSSMGVVIQGKARPYGVLGAHARRRAAFPPTDLPFLQAVANVLATAIERKAMEDALRRSHDELETRVRERTTKLTVLNQTLQAEVAERRRAEVALRESEQLYRSIIYVPVEGFVIVDAGGQVVAYNPSAKRILGLAASSTDRSLSYDAVWEQLLRKGRPVAQTLQTGNPCSNVVLSLDRPDRTQVWINLSTQPLARDNESRPYAIVVSFSDITERRRAEDLRSRFIERVISAQEEERRRIARELHDGLGQTLTSLLPRLRILEETPTLEGVLARVPELQRLIVAAADEMRFLARALRPPALDELGLGAALEHYTADYTRAHGVPIHLFITGLDSGRLPREVETTLYRIAQEALTNVGKYASAQTVTVVLKRQPAFVQMLVEDDGCGFDCDAVLRDLEPKGHLGLVGMQERASLLGGSLTIESKPGSGTTVCVRIPLKEEGHGKDPRVHYR
jgi:PAS domain S-box-containing protein